MDQRFNTVRNLLVDAERHNTGNESLMDIARRIVRENREFCQNIEHIIFIALCFHRAGFTVTVATPNDYLDLDHSFLTAEVVITIEHGGDLTMELSFVDTLVFPFVVVSHGVEREIVSREHCEQMFFQITKRIISRRNV